jgi:hypothetical protein
MWGNLLRFQIITDVFFLEKLNGSVKQKKEIYKRPIYTRNLKMKSPYVLVEFLPSSPFDFDFPGDGKANI